MKVAIMQPYFLPYIGYWQLIEAVDKFVIYDNIKYTKKGWINRNRYLLNGKDAVFTIPLKKDSDYLDINQRHISSDYDKNKLITRLRNAYNKASMMAINFPVIEEIISFQSDNLFDYISNSIKKICRHLDINTKIVVSSSIDINHELKSEQKVLAYCKKLGAKTYINPIGGTGLYSKENFENQGIQLMFIKPKPIFYKQFCETFVESLSILDVLMFNSNEDIKIMLGEYDFA